MQLNTKANRLAWRYVPNNATIIDDGYCIAYEYELPNGKLAAVGYRGTSSKADFHYTYPTQERRRKSINEWRTSVAEHEDRKNQRKLERQNFKHTLKVGDILDSSWGYEQTNIDFYQVTEVKGKFIVVREVAQTKKYERDDYGTCMPVKDKFISDEITKKVVGNGQYQGINISSYEYASPWDGRPRSWTAWH